VLTTRRVKSTYDASPSAMPSPSASAIETAVPALTRDHAVFRLWYMGLVFHVVMCISPVSLSAAWTTTVPRQQQQHALACGAFRPGPCVVLQPRRRESTQSYSPPLAWYERSVTRRRSSVLSVVPQQPDCLSMRSVVTVHEVALQQRAARQQHGTGHTSTQVLSSHSTSSPYTSACGPGADG